jgi:glycosyltransferase involved in cell wall biosynthesis
MGIVGRIQFKQKGHDFLINALSENVDQLGNFKLLVVGDGPDRYALESMVNQQGLAEYVIFIPWHDDLSFVYSSLDVVLIPSRFEGLPLVMLESMYHNVPVLASNRDGMKEVLPEEWLFDCCDSDSFIKSLLRIKNMDNTDFIKKNKLKIISEFDVENFGRSFYEAITNN